MLLAHSYASLLVETGAAHFGHVVTAPDGRALLEVIRPARRDKIDYCLADPKAPDPPSFLHPKGLPDRLPIRPRAPRRKPLTHDVLTEKAPGQTLWKRPKAPRVKGEVKFRRRCPNCETLTNSAEHCVGTRTVPLNPKPAPVPSVLGPDRPYKPPKFRRVCRVCGALTNEPEHCDVRTLGR